MEEIGKYFQGFQRRVDPSHHSHYVHFTEDEGDDSESSGDDAPNGGEDEEMEEDGEVMQGWSSRHLLLEPS